MRQRNESRGATVLNFVIQKEAAGGMPPMDPAMGGMPPMDPSMGGMPPMDPAMGGMPPMNPAMGGMPPMDPAMGGMPPMDPAMVPPGMDVGQDKSSEVIDQLTATVEALTKTTDKMSKTIEIMSKRLEAIAPDTDGADDEIDEDAFSSLLEDDEFKEDVSPIEEAMPDYPVVDAQEAGYGDVNGEEDQTLENPESQEVLKEASAMPLSVLDILKKNGMV